MEFTKLKLIRQKLGLKALLATTLMATISCTKAVLDETTTASNGTTYSISGTMTIGGISASSLSASAYSNEFDKVMRRSVTCSDGYEYQVYCVSFSVPPVAASGSVTCTGGTGSFTVDGLPKSETVGCFVRRKLSTDTDYSTLGTVEFPAANLNGSSSSIAANGDLSISVDVNTDGSIVASIDSGDDAIVETPTEDIQLTANDFNGIYALSCADVGATGEYSAAKCLCNMVSEQDSTYAAAYACGGTENPQVNNSCSMGPHEACLADNAAALSAKLGTANEYIELFLHQATALQNIPIKDKTGNNHTIPSGTVIPIISVWKATDATTSIRSAGANYGEGASTMNNMVSWSGSGISSSVGFPAQGASIQLSNGVTTSMATLPTLPGTTSDWKTWLQSLVTNSSGFTCQWGDNNNKSTDAGCLAEFADHYLRNANAILPRIFMDRSCSQTGCDSSIANARVHVDGIQFDNSGNGTLDGPVIGLNHRYAFEIFEPSSNGGGGFKQSNHQSRQMACATTSTNGNIESSLCTGTNGAKLRCDFREETAIQFIPTETVGTLNLLFQQRSVPVYAEIVNYSNSGQTTINDYRAFELCKESMGNQEGKFLMQAVKQ